MALAALVTLVAWSRLASEAPAAVICTEPAPNHLEAFDAEFPHAFGSALSIDQDTMIVGAPGAPVWGTHSGAAYVYRRVGGSWQFQSQLTADDGAPFDRFGAAVAVSGAYAIIGAPGRDDAGEDAGTVYIFQRFGNVWVQIDRIDPPEGLGAKSFGAALDLDGAQAIIGIRNAAFAYQRVGQQWYANSFLIPDGWPATSEFGASIRIRGNLAIIGNPGDDPVVLGQPRLDAGAAYIHSFNGVTWQRTAKLTAFVPDQRDWFGASVDIDADIAVIGAPRDDAANPSDPKNDAGAIYIFRRSGNQWNPSYLVKPDDAAQRDNFGISLAISPYAIVVGSSRDDTYNPADRHDDAGSVYVLRRGNLGSAIIETKVLPHTARSGANFGRVIAADGAAAVIGAPSDDSQCPGLYLCQSGSVSIITGLTDCNQNNRLDICDIAIGAAPDADSDGMIDGCVPCASDINLDGVVDVDDLTMILSNWGQTVPSNHFADLDGDGVISASDLNGILAEWASSCW